MITLSRSGARNLGILWLFLCVRPMAVVVLDFLLQYYKLFLILVFWFDIFFSEQNKFFFSVVSDILYNYKMTFVWFFLQELKPGLWSQKFLGGAGVGFLITLRVGFCCLTPEVHLDPFFYITLLSWEFLLKWYNFFWNFWHHNFHWLLIATKLLTTKVNFVYVKESESEIFWKDRVIHFTTDSVTLFKTQQNYFVWIALLVLAKHILLKEHYQ